MVIRCSKGESNDAFLGKSIAEGRVTLLATLPVVSIVEKTFRLSMLDHYPSWHALL